MRGITRQRQQRGAVIITVALFLLFLLGFMAFALDFGRLFIVKTELQTALDSCALAAARELDHQSDAITRARSAGTAAGNQNRVNLQSASWNGQGQLVGIDHIDFLDKDYGTTSTAANATYARCTYTMSSIRLWLMQAMGTFTGDTTTYPATGVVGSLAVATRASAQTTCPVPLALKPKGTGTAPDYGYTVGEWITLLDPGGGGGSGGQIGWANLDGSNNASETEAEMNGRCGTKIGDTLGTPGTQSTIVDSWNYRFGIYKNKGEPSVNRPDFTGYGYTEKNWVAKSNAYGDFATKRLAFASCGTSVKNCEDTIDRKLNSFKEVATSAEHQQYGADRRVVTVPIIDASRHVINYACMLMLQPLSQPMVDVQLEYIGNAGNATSPCASSGLAGGAAGPLVPVLVR